MTNAINRVIRTICLFVILLTKLRGIAGWISTTTTTKCASVGNCYSMKRDVLFAPISTSYSRYQRWHRRSKQSAHARERSGSSIQSVKRSTLMENNSVVASPYDATNNKGNLLEVLLSWFQGDFDNYRQVVLDRMEGLLPREHGGHEHIHCSLIPVSHTTRLAAFYFDGIPNAIFRFRFYQLQSRTNNTVDTILYTLSKPLEIQLRSCPDPMRWAEIFKRYVWEQNVSQTTDISNDEGFLGSNCNDTIADLAIQSSCVSILPNCEVRWSYEWDIEQHSYVSNLSQNSISNGIHAIMVHGEALVDSQMIPGQKILIKDQLSLWEDQLWIHDRGYNPTTGEYIYGNQRGIPYRMQRVTNMIHAKQNKDNQGSQYQLVITDPDLAWTLGNNYRTQVEYEKNMNVIGGPSIRK